MRVLLNDVIVASAEKVVVGVRKLETLVSKVLQGILKAQEEALAKYIANHRDKSHKRLVEAHKDAEEILRITKVRVDNIKLEAGDDYYNACTERCKIIRKKHDLIQKRTKGL